MTDAAIRAACNVMGPRPECQWPECRETCSKVPEAVRAALATASGGWNFDMSTAPRDGTPIIVVHHDASFGWVRGWARWDGAAGIYGWISYGFFEVPGALGLAHPDCWQPLPSPPSQEGSGG